MHDVEESEVGPYPLINKLISLTGEPQSRQSFRRNVLCIAPVIRLRGCRNSTPLVCCGGFGLALILPHNKDVRSDRTEVQLIPSRLMPAAAKFNDENGSGG